jgi:hypothetical protein
MATTPSSIIRFQTSSPSPGVKPGGLVTPVTQHCEIGNRLPPRRVLFSLPKDPEDARITGGTRSLARRLLALNLYGGHPGSDAA